MKNNQIVRITIVAWNSYTRMFGKASENIRSLETDLFSSKSMDRSADYYQKAVRSIKEADIVFLYRTSEGFWEDFEKEIKGLDKGKPVISVGYNPSCWLLSTVSPEKVATCYSYLTFGGKENIRNLLFYMLHALLGIGDKPPVPVEFPWEGIYHPKMDSICKSISEYLDCFKQNTSLSKIGLLFSRSYWLNENCDFIDELISNFEKRDFLVIPVFSYSVKDKSLGTKSGAEAIREYLMDENGKSRVDALVKLTPLFSGDELNEDGTSLSVSEKAVKLFKTLNVPVFQPVLTSYKTIPEWEEDPHGLGSLTAWYVTLPEFEGVIEPIICAATSNNSELKKLIPIKDRCNKIAERVSQWINLGKKPVQERKIAFILHNNPCASVEASVGGAANLDSLESTACILQEMKKAGYKTDPPDNGKKLISTITQRKAISEFRWTTVDEIIRKGGCLKRVPVEEYNEWFDGLTEKFKKRITDVWGNPPGEKKNGVPAAMVYQGDIVVTGVQYGNAVVCTQPKRGCAGSRCDGQVCKILHDPDLPPPHQYFATYRFLEYGFKADCIVHVGTHGNLEFLPGKGVGLSQDCSPDLAIGNIPHIYIYNADNPPEGAIAKRRSYATLIDHMQVVMTKSGVNDDIEELEKFLGEYYEAKSINKSRAHQLEHLITDTIEKTNLSKEIRYTKEMPFEEVAIKAHEAISLIRSSQINKGLHVFGNLPQNENRIDYIRSIFRADTDNGLSLRSSIVELIGADLSEILAYPGKMNREWKISNGQLLEHIDEIAGKFIAKIIENNIENSSEIIQELLTDKIKNNNVLNKFPVHAELIREINKRIEDSKEIRALLSGFNGDYIPSGPSGKITRGRYDVLPSGRNFYTLDIYRLPTKAAYRVGVNLANSVIEKHIHDEGRLPENVAIYWTCMDITCCDGEGMAQMMALLGAKPVWLSNGRVNGFEIISLKELKRPRIDVTVRVGGINRDNFPECMAYIDEVIRKIASLNEPVELNFVRKHALEQLNDKENPDDKNAWQEVTSRIFGSKPGTYMAGVNLAVYASAWKDEKDLTDVFVYWNQYAYGKNIFGKEMAGDFIANLKTVDITFNKAYTDEYDLFGCCCYFATQGGMTVSARVISGKNVKAYYGDTRDTKNVGVRDLSDEVRRIVRSKLLNPKWIEGMKQHGYKGLGDISKKIGRVYGWEATTGEVDDWIFDDITRTYVLDEEMRNEFEKNNPWALEEIGRRLLEANERGLWNADPEVLEQLKDKYIEVESWLEEKMGDIEGDFQGGSIDILTQDEVDDWGEKLKEVRTLLHK